MHIYVRLEINAVQITAPQPGLQPNGLRKANGKEALHCL